MQQSKLVLGLWVIVNLYNAAVVTLEEEGGGRGGEKGKGGGRRLWKKRAGGGRKEGGREEEKDSVGGENYIFEPLDPFIPWSVQLQKPISHPLATTCLS